MIKALRTLTDDPVTTARSTRKTTGTTAVAKKQSPRFLQSQRLRPPWQHPPGARPASYKRRGLLSVRERETLFFCGFFFFFQSKGTLRCVLHFVEMKNPNRINNYCFQWDRRDWLLNCSQSKESLLAWEWKKEWKRKDTGINLIIITVSFYCLVVTATIWCCVNRRMKYVA